MLEIFNNVWCLVFAFILLVAIFKKICNLNKPFDEARFIEKYQNQHKLKNKFSLELLPKNLPKMAQYYVGLH